MAEPQVDTRPERRPLWDEFWDSPLGAFVAVLVVLALLAGCLNLSVWIAEHRSAPAHARCTTGRSC